MSGTSEFARSRLDGPAVARAANSRQRNIARVESRARLAPANQPRVESFLVAVLFTLVPLTGALAAVAAGSSVAVRIASFSLPALLAAIVGGVCLATAALMLPLGVVPGRVGRVAVFWIPAGAAMAASALAGVVTRQGLQFVEVLICSLSALLFAAGAAAVLQARLEPVLRTCLRVTTVALVAIALVHAAGVPINANPRTNSIVALVAMAWFLAEHRHGESHSLLWALSLLGAITFSLSRGALVAAALVLAVALGAGRALLTRAAAIVAIVVAGFWLASTWAPLHDRIFQGDVTTVHGIRLNDEGRTAVWSQLWSEVPSDWLLGHGPGSAAARSVVIDPAFDQPHNDYLRLIYDFGAVGCACLVAGGLVTRRELRHRPAAQGSLAQTSAFAGRLASLGVLVLMLTDNPLDYPFVMMPLAALIGIGLASGDEQIDGSRGSGSEDTIDLSVSAGPRKPIADESDALTTSSRWGKEAL